jgi:peptidoglycan biosynthesis protein MviN/MurJ (putative lipid II flippase)
MIYATTLLVNILSNLWLIPKLGVMGAPLSALISYTTAFAFQLWFIDPQFAPLAPWADISKALVACGVMGFVVASLELPAGITGLAMGIAVGVLTYGLLAYALDLAGVRRMVSRHRLVV